MKLAFALAVAASLTITTTPADATLLITYDGQLRPISVSGLPVLAAPFLIDVTIDYSGLSFNDQYDAADPPAGSPGGLTWGNLPLAEAVSASLSDALIADLTPPAVDFFWAQFTHSASASEVGSVSLSLLSPGGGFAAVLPRGDDGFNRWGWATVSAVPEPGTFLPLCLAGLGFAGWKRRTANRGLSASDSVEQTFQRLIDRIIEM